MAKLKGNNRNKNPNTVATKAKTTTPQVTNGKVHKVRVNIKQLKTNIKSNEPPLTNSIKSNTDETVSQQTSLCFVKLRRTDVSSLSNNNNNNDSTTTLQEQCKVGNKNNGINTEILKEITSLEKRPHIVGTKMRTRGQKNQAEDNMHSEHKTRGIGKKVQEAVLKNNMVAGENENTPLSVLDNNSISGSTKIPEKQCYIKLTHLNRLEKENSGPQNVVKKGGRPKPVKQCLVKIQRTPIAKKINTTTVPITPTTKRCEVRLNKSKITNGNVECKNTLGASSSITTKDFVVRLQRTPVSHKHIEDSECSETQPSTSLFPLPVIDESKRNNFRKLSLTKATRKSADTKELETTKTNLNQEYNKNKPGQKQHSEEPHTNSTETEETKTLANPLKIFERFKNIEKLSLKKRNVQNNENVTTNLEVTQFEPQQNSTICFEPGRNSTLLEFGFTKDNTQEKADKTTKNINRPTQKSLSPNLANKSEEIVNLLNSLDEEDEMLVKSQDKPKDNDNFVAQQTKMSSSKFFKHRMGEARVNGKKLQTAATKTQEVTKRRRFQTKRSTINKKDNIYEFLSQSQTSDSDNATKREDPTADIIKKLIAQGKVRVATNLKGKGKPILKRRPPPKQMKRIKQAADKKMKQLKNNNKTSNTKVNEIVELVEDEVIIDHFDDFDRNDDDDHDMDNQRSEAVVQRINNHNKNHTNDQEGTFSRLARTVLISQAGRSDMERRKASLLLEKVRKFVSTPKNNKIPTPKIVLESNLSPIAIPPQRPPTKPSPWRVNEDAYLPKTFNFNRSSGNLPSFSSDFIPSTPRKEKPKGIQNESLRDQTEISNNKSPIIGNQNIPSITSIISPLRENVEREESLNILTSMTPIQSPLGENVERVELERTPNVIQTSVLSSFSSNDSNGENMPPPRTTSKSLNENEDIFALKQIPNPRRGLTYRSPLKEIRILDVVHLPPLKIINKDTNSKELKTPAVEMFGFEENLEDETFEDDQSTPAIRTPQKKRVPKKTENGPKEDLFGFEEFLSQTDLSSQEFDGNNNNDSVANNGTNLTIHDKLQDLRKLKPDEQELQISLLKEKSRKPLKAINLFDDVDASITDGMRQRGIKEMLCSTMIHPEPSTSKKALLELKRRNLQQSKKPNFEEEFDLSELFKDPEPETTFNENEAHRSYTRPYKRKRRLKQNNFIMFLDSDDSGDEHSAERQKHQNSRETDTSSEQAPKKKRTRKEPKEKPELTEFVEEFNEMCKDVDSYELVVEKSA